ncbi:CBD9-like protein [Stemphylium lycopersici]|nr:iron reductase domain protein [Stemphylium lycopersici]RAR08851.1 CBD9-like protein [Stemphylium lycopersici]
MKGGTRATALGLLALAYRASAQVANICPSTDVCFGLNIPESTASSGSGDIFFQISAPSSYEWVALGQGSGMANSNIFVVYTSSSGSNVTLSPRRTSSYQPPSHNTDAQVELLEGSGVSNGIMTANVRCSNCESWSGGTMDFTASSGDWIYGYQSSGGPKDTDDTSASIREHSEKAAFSWDFANAKGGSSVNPLVSASPTGTSGGSATPNCRQRPSSASATPSGAAGQASAKPTGDDADDNDYKDRPYGGYPTSYPTGAPPGRFAYEKRQEELPYCDELPNNGGTTNGNSNAGFIPIGSSGGIDNRREMVIAHGVLASLAFVVLFPAGSIAIRLASFPGLVWIHGAFQIFAYVVYIAGFGLGAYLASQMNLLDHHHPIIGIVVLAALFFQPVFGWMHHLLFKKYQHRTLWSYAHIWVGRLAITLGIINGGLGLHLAECCGLSSRTGQIVYGVVSAVIWLVWVAAMVVGEMRRKRAPVAADTRQKLTEERRESDQSDVNMTGNYAPKEQ